MIWFEAGPGNYKYSAYVRMKNGYILGPINFGNRQYGQYKDRALGLYKNMDHLDKKRRENYRKRHGAILTSTGKRAVDVKYSPAWFAWNYLW